MEEVASKRRALHTMERVRAGGKLIGQVTFFRNFRMLIAITSP